MTPHGLGIPVYNCNCFIFQTKSRSVLLRRVHAGHWYQYRVAAAAEAGSQGYSALSKPFKSSRGI